VYDINPLISTKGLTKKEHDNRVDKVNPALNEEAVGEQPEWDQSKETKVEFGWKPRTRCKLLVVEINCDLNFRRHVGKRLKKGKACLRILLRISNSISRISPKAARALYTGYIRPIMTYGSKAWYLWQGSLLKVEIERTPYTTLRAITGGYGDCFEIQLGFVANVKRVTTILEDLHKACAERGIRKEDPKIVSFVDSFPAPNHYEWHDGRFPHPKLDGSITTAIVPSGALRDSMSHGHANDHRKGQCTHLNNFDPSNEESKKAYPGPNA